MRKMVARFADDDVVYELLRGFRVDSSVLCRSVMGSPWGFGVANRDIGSFHMVLAGEGWLEAEGVDELVHLRSGDLVVLPNGNAHWVRDSPSTAAPSLTAILAQNDVVDGELRFGGDHGPLTEIVCGVFRGEGAGAKPWSERLPSVIRSAADPTRNDWRDAVAVALRDEARSPTIGGSAVVNRLLESLIADAFREELADLMRENTAPAVGLADHRIGRALGRIHESPEAPWSIESLAEIAVMSRSAFSSRFRSLVGQPPMRYVTGVRLDRARRLLLSTDLTLAEIAKRVGYASESALSRAHRANFGYPPSGFRRHAGPRAARAAAPPQGGQSFGAR